MSIDKCKIHFNPDNLEIVVDRGTNLLTAALAAGVHISASCGSLGICGTCKVKIESGSVKSSRTDKITQEEYDRGIRQACQCQVISDLSVIIPVESRVDRTVRARERNRASGVIPTGWKFNPPVKKYLLNLPPASLKDNATDYFRVMYGLNRSYNLPDWPIDFEVLPKLTSVLRAKDWQVTVTMIASSDKPPAQDFFTYKIINVEAGDTRGQIYAIAVDVGTTNICAQLLDLVRGQIISEGIVPNQQIAHGDDCYKRIEFSRQPGGLNILQGEVVSSINQAIDKLLGQVRIDREHITYISSAGNTTMQHILVGFNPDNILKDPFIPVANFIPMLKACQIGINVPDHVYLFSSPNVSSLVGGDVVSGVIASGIQQRKKLSLFIDIGTSTEIAMGNSEWMVSAACSTTPVFEGIGIKNGMAAMPGAIQDITLDARLTPTFKTVCDIEPCGLCGSGLIAAIAELRMAGIIGADGKFKTGIKSERIRKTSGGTEFVLLNAAQNSQGQDIVISQSDIDRIIPNKAAIYAATRSLSSSVNINLNDFEQVVLAGSMGNTLNIEKAIIIGLLPDIPKDKFVYLGNASLSGARLVTFSTDILDDSRTLAQMMTNVELNESNNYSNNYKSALALPHCNPTEFPSVTQKLKPAS
jgi:uncharacterized 2Fe-2S/4Fe-4S cluster protein (DUF4445 family)